MKKLLLFLFITSSSLHSMSYQTFSEEEKKTKEEQKVKEIKIDIPDFDEDEDDAVKKKEKLPISKQLGIIAATGIPAIASSYFDPHSLVTYYFASMFGGSSKVFLRNFPPAIKYAGLLTIWGATYYAENHTALPLHLSNIAAVLVAAALKRDIKLYMMGKEEKASKKSKEKTPKEELETNEVEEEKYLVI